jgi:hypothetical protein
MGEKYEFFPDELKAQIPKLYSQEGNKDPTVYMKLFTPWTNWTWYITEGEDRDGDYLMFGYVIGHEREWGYISLNELKAVKGPMGLKIERDIHFSSKPASQISDIHSHYKPKAEEPKAEGEYCGVCDKNTLHEGGQCVSCIEQSS